MRGKGVIALLCLLAAACVEQESPRFGPPSFVSVDSELQGREAVLLKCVLTDSRLESCGFMYGQGEQLDRVVECRLSGNGFQTVLSGITPGVVYTWCAFARAGESEILSQTNTFRLTADTDPIPVEDAAFRSYLVLHFDSDHNGEVSYNEAKTITRISISPTNEYNLQSLQGIEYMPNLEEIDCPGEWGGGYGSSAGTLRYVDVTGNPRLKVLNLAHNGALQGNLDVSGNPELEVINLGRTGLEYPDISSNTALKFIQFSHLRGTLPDLSDLHKVQSLFMEWPQDNPEGHIRLDLSGMPELETLFIGGGEYELSDFAANPLLKTLYCPSCGLGSLDVSGLESLESLECWGNQIEALDVSNNLKLSFLDCSPMDDGHGNNLLATLSIARRQTIPDVTVDRNADRIPVETRIVDVTPYPANDEIWYSTVSGTPISIRYSNMCPGLSIVSNTYQEGRGVLKFSGTVKTFKEWALYDTRDLLELEIPSGVIATTYSCFRECQQLRRAVFAPGLEILGDSSLHHNEVLEEVILPDTVKSIEKDALSHAYSLRHIDIPPYLETLGRSAFLYCTALESIVLPATLKSIGIYAFEHDIALRSVTCLATEPPAGSTEMFDDTSECPIYVPASSVDAYRSAPYWSKYSYRIRAIEE